MVMITTYSLRFPPSARLFHSCWDCDSFGLGEIALHRVVEEIGTPVAVVEKVCNVEELITH